MGLIFLAFFLAIAQTNLISLPPSAPTQPWQVAANRDCSYEAVSQQSQKVNALNFTISPPSYSNDSNGGIIKDYYKRLYEGKTWVLVKRNAQIPHNKVWGLGKESMAHREMDVIAKAKENGVDKWIFIALGHCNFDDNANCYDPLTAITIYTLQAKGIDRCQYNDTDSNCHTYGNITDVIQSPKPNFWIFNVYIWEGQLIRNNGEQPNYGSDDLPCWLTQCLEGDIKEKIRDDLETETNKVAWNASCQKGTLPPEIVLTITPRPTTALGRSLGSNEAFPPSFIYRWWVITPYPTSFGQLATYLWFAGKIERPGDISYGTIKGKLGDKEVTFNVSLKTLKNGYINDIVLILSSPDGNNHYLYVPTDFSDARQGENLKLGTFKPTVGYVYQWWYPSCKPVIYLYPEKETSFDVTLKPFGIITESIPSYPWLTGWKNILAKPSGELTYQGEKYDSLYFEGRTFFVKVPKVGFTIKGTEMSQFFDIILPKLGLIDKEITDFKAYWLSRLNDRESYYFVAILPREEIDRVEGLQVSPSPNSLIRVRLFFKKLDKPQLYPLPDFPDTPERRGTTVVDWGGFFDKGLVD